MKKKILRGDEARSALIRGAKVVADATVSTLGAKGRNVAIERLNAPPHVVHDGVTVARNINLVDSFENMGCDLIKEASQRTNDICGDGTTTSAALAISILEEGNRYITAGMNPMEMKKGIDKATTEAIDQLKEMAIPVKREDLLSVATIASASEEIGQIVAQAIEAVGKDGKLTAEAGGIETIVEYKDGMEFDGGYFSQHFVTNKRQEAEISDTYVYITCEELDSHVDLLPFFKNVEGKLQNKNIVFIAPKIERGALNLLVANNAQGIIKTVGINGGRNLDVLQDLCAVVGAKLIGRQQGINFADADMEHLGFAKKILATNNKTIVINDKNQTLQDRIELLENTQEKNPILQERIVNRLARLKGGIAVIEVGAPSDTEREEKLERVKDAIGATMSALEQGIVPGGETALLRIKLTSKGDNEHQQAGIEALRKALVMPCKALLDNAGVNSAYWLEEIKKAKKGFDVVKEKLVDMVEVGIIDPVKVTITALRNASSVAGMILTTDTLVAVVLEDENGKTT